MSGLTSRIGNLVRALRSEWQWLVHEFLPAPRFALYVRRQDRLNQALFRGVKDHRAAGRNPRLEAYYPRDIPKTVWIYWAQGVEAAPPVVARCIDSWQRHNPGWDVRVLDSTTADTLVDMKDLPDFVPLRYRANLLRMRLLKQFGGVWADATVLCHRPLDDWLPLQAASGFFVFANPGPDRDVSSWFIASEPGGRLITAWEEAYTAFLRRLRRMPRAYFMVMYSFQWRVLNDPAAHEAHRRAATLPAPPAFLLMSAIEGRTPLAQALVAIERGLPVSKLSWKSKVEPTDIDAVLDALTGGASGSAPDAVSAP